MQSQAKALDALRKKKKGKKKKGGKKKKKKWSDLEFDNMLPK